MYPVTPSFAGIKFSSGWSPSVPDSVVPYERPSVAIGAVVKNLQRVLCVSFNVAFSFSHSC